MEQNGAVFKRLTWFGLGAAAGATGYVWAQQRVRRELDALGPDHIVVVAGNQARRVGKQVGRTVTGAVGEGRSAMRDREDELLARRDGHRWPGTTQREPLQRGAPRRDERSRRDGGGVPERPTRPATW